METNKLFDNIKVQIKSLQEDNNKLSQRNEDLTTKVATQKDYIKIVEERLYQINAICDNTIARQKDYIKMLEERLDQINAICDKEGIPKRMKVEGGLTAGIQTQARVEMLVDAYKNRLLKTRISNGD